MGPALSPAVHGARAFSLRILPLHVAGLLVGGVALGLLAGALGSLLSVLAPLQPLGTLVAAAILLYAIFEIAPWRLWRPNSLWQVPEGFRRTPYAGTMAFLWGVPLGFGWVTANVTSAFVVTWLAMLVVPPDMALVTAVTFSLARAATLLLTMGSQDFEIVANRFNNFARYRRTARVVSAGLGGCLAAFILLTL